ncbi:MAG: HEAT repeat domain-containing protein [Candidatus Cloacimonadaceae bacterium]
MNFNSIIIKHILLIMAFFCLTIGVSWASYDILNPAELDAIDTMLASEGFGLEHLSFYRDWDTSTKAKSPWVMKLLNEGVHALDQVSYLRKIMDSGDKGAIITHLMHIAWDVDTPFVSREAIRFKNPKALFKFAEKRMDDIALLWDTSFEKLSAEQRDKLLSMLILTLIESSDLKQYQSLFERYDLHEPESFDIEEMIELIEMVDFEKMARAVAQANDLHEIFKHNRFENKKIKYYKSRHGLMIYGSIANDAYYGLPRKYKDIPVCVLIDPAGNDVYELSLFARKAAPLVFFLDFEGDDFYHSGDPFFSGLGGIFMGSDLAGDDVYALHDLSFAAVLGASVFEDIKGDDSYQGGIFSQGAALLGISALIDEEGNDSYRAHASAQAFGGCLGAGLLADYEGSDSYYLGGRYFHAPLMPLDYRTMGQGMGFGMRPHLAGGLGLLYDKDGSDKYMGGVYAQGVGYWYSAGILIDEGGNDVYNAVYYPQGSGIHMACGVLYDHSGNDAYYSRNGPGQGAGHDWSFGILVDGGGDDAYSIHGGNGLGLSNSLGVFVDREGNDRYERHEVQNYGSANFSRSTGGIGIFLDGGGEDLYPQGEMANNSSWLKGTYGFGMDAELYEKPEEEEEAATVYDQDDPPEEDAPIKEIFAAAAEWEVGSAIQRVREARRIMKERADEAIEYILENKLANNSGLEYRALQSLAEFSEDFRDRLLERATDVDSLVAKTAISLLAGEEDRRLIPILSNYIEKGQYLPTCISSLGMFDFPESIELLTSYPNPENERLRFLKVRSISMHKSDAAKEALRSFEDDDSFLIQALLRKINKDDI